MIMRNHIYGILTLLFAGPVYASLNCTQQPTCESLGYVDTDVSDCAANAVIACPFDMTYKKCIVQNQTTKSCTELGFTADDKSSWCGNIITCESDNAYTACVGEKQCSKSNAELTATCGTSGAKGWTMSDSTFDKDRCPLECVAKDCPTGSDTTEKAASYGISVVAMAGYTGDTACTKEVSCPKNWAYKAGVGEKLQLISLKKMKMIGPKLDGRFEYCAPLECSESVSSVSDCGTKGLTGWQIGKSVNLGCNYCIARTCPSGSSPEHELQVSNCYEETVAGYSGDTPCYTLTQCAYDCSGVGGKRCSSSSTYAGESCRRCGGGSSSDKDIITGIGGINRDPTGPL